MLIRVTYIYTLITGQRPANTDKNVINSGSNVVSCNREKSFLWQMCKFLSCLMIVFCFMSIMPISIVYKYWPDVTFAASMRRQKCDPGSRFIIILSKWSSSQSIFTGNLEKVYRFSKRAKLLDNIFLWFDFCIKTQLSLRKHTRRWVKRQKVDLVIIISSWPIVVWKYSIK